MILREVTILTIHESARIGAEVEQKLQQFDRHTAHIGDLYRQCLSGIDTAQTAKVIVDVSSEAGWCTPANVKRLLNVTQSPWEVCFDTYWNAEIQERKAIALSWLHDGLLWLADIEGWPREPFQIAHAACLERGLVNEFFWRKGKSFPNPSKTASVKLFCEFDVIEARYYAVVFVKRKEAGRVLLGTTIPESYINCITLQSFEWVDDQTASIRFGDRYRDPPTLCDLSSLIPAAQ
ncbi:MAG: hypothetical protein H6821_02175 [Planctomycetaceae bacterium]|nr:hypothetical protein [Planctomycetales bacterium]MCB9872960.1 hypothetical protein [Planctomycetaceae bacterium]MCB9937549.1 hypothetical protein [Planctomycetaceae bacterium]